MCLFGLSGTPRLFLICGMTTIPRVGTDVYSRLMSTVTALQFLSASERSLQWDPQADVGAPLAVSTKRSRRRKVRRRKKRFSCDFTLIAQLLCFSLAFFLSFFLSSGRVYLGLFTMSSFFFASVCFSFCVSFHKMHLCPFFADRKLSRELFILSCFIFLFGSAFF